MAGDKGILYVYVYGVPSTVTPAFDNDHEVYLPFTFYSSYWSGGIYTDLEAGTVVISAAGFVDTSISYSSSGGSETISPKPLNLYKWTTSSAGEYVASFYTSTANPDTSSRIYDMTGVDQTSTYIHGECLIDSASSSAIIYNAAVGADIPIGVTPGGGLGGIIK